MKGIDYNQY